MALTGSRAAEALVGYRGETPASRRSAKKHASFENPPDSRNSSRSRKEADHNCTSTQPQGSRQAPHSESSSYLRVVLIAASSFSLPRKKQRGPEGAAELRPWTSAPSGLPPSPPSRLCSELHSPHGPRGGVPQLVRSSATRCVGLPFGQPSAAGTTASLLWVRRKKAPSGWREPYSCTRAQPKRYRVLDREKGVERVEDPSRVVRAEP